MASRFVSDPRGPRSGRRVFGSLRCLSAWKVGSWIGELVCDVLELCRVVECQASVTSERCLQLAWSQNHGPR
eukprot:3757026-Rhodomonas_salina.2